MRVIWIALKLMGGVYWHSVWFRGSRSTVIVENSLLLAALFACHSLWWRDVHYSGLRASCIRWQLLDSVQWIQYLSRKLHLQPGSHHVQTAPHSRLSVGNIQVLVKIEPWRAQFTQILYPLIYKRSCRLLLISEWQSHCKRAAASKL